MKNNQLNNFEYIKQLEKENIILKEENISLKHRLLHDYKEDNIILLQKEFLIESLKKELAKLRHQNAMLMINK